jgi:probable F420-dependent oxidoreductase
MSALGLGPVGIALPSLAEEGDLAQAVGLERLGYGTLWLRGGHLDRLGRAADVLAATQAAVVATAIIPVDGYPPDAVAALHAQLEASAPGRFLAGLGGPQRARPLGPLNDYLDALDRADPPLPAARRILAALGPRKLQLARDRSAGAIALLVTPGYTRTARRLLGRDSALIIDQMVVLGTDAAQARELARGPLRFLSRVPGYAANFARMGFTAADIGQLSDHLVDELVTWGDPGLIAARVREHLEAGADQVALTILNQAGHLDAARLLAGHLLPA